MSEGGLARAGGGNWSSRVDNAAERRSQRRMGADLAGQLRAVFRLLRVGMHLTWGLATVATVYPFLRRPARLWLKRRWSAQLVTMLGVRCRVAGELPPGPRLLVANHVSWLDIFVINAIAPTAFVCKADVRDWPVIGWLCAKTETVFLPRGSRSAARQTAGLIASRLAEGWLVAVFPEGTTSDGRQVLPFHAALLQGALDAGQPIQPLALRYGTLDGCRSVAPAYYGDITLLQSLWRIARQPAIIASLSVLPGLVEGRSRREAGELAWRRISAVIQDGDIGPESTTEDGWNEATTPAFAR